MTKIKLESNIKIKKKFKDISENNWSNIAVELQDIKGENWSNLGFQALYGRGLNQNNTKLFARRSNGYAFVDGNVFNETRDLFTDGKIVLPSIDTMGIYHASNGTWSSAQLLPNYAFSNYLFTNNKDMVGRNFRSNDFFIYYQYGGKDHGKIRSLQVLKFLQKYCSDYEFNTIYFSGAEVEANEVGLPEPVNPPVPPVPNTNPNNPDEEQSPFGKQRSLLKEEDKEIEQVAQIIEKKD